MKSIDERVAAVWDSDVRPLVVEAWTCYGVGAYRATVVLTWLAVFTDLTAKIQLLADDGEAEAARFARGIDEAREHGLSGAGVQKMQNAERELLECATKIELIDDIVKRELDRLREDRHLCAHPPLRPLGEPYSPSAELARAHLSAALDGVLCHPPTQGRGVVERFKKTMADPAFVLSETHFVQTYYERVRPAARRQIVDLAAKVAILGVGADDADDVSRRLGERMAACLELIAVRDRVLVSNAVAKCLDRLSSLDSSTLMAATSVHRAGRLELFWECIDDATMQRIVDHIPSVRVVDRWGRIDDEGAAVLALVGISQASERLPRLASKLETLKPLARRQVLGIRPSIHFAGLVAEQLQEASSFQTAAEITENIVLPHAPLMQLDHLDACLDAWGTNGQCLSSFRMPELAVALFERTRHLWPASRSVWRRFVDALPSVEDDDYYSYPDLRDLVG